MILVQLGQIDQNIYFHNEICKNFIQGETNKVSQESGDPIFGDLNAKALRTLVQQKLTTFSTAELTPFAGAEDDDDDEEEDTYCAPT